MCLDYLFLFEYVYLVKSNEEIPEKRQVKNQCDYYTCYQCLKKRAIVAAFMTEGTTILERKSTSRHISEK